MRSGTTERQIEITDNDLYDGEEDRMFAVILSLLGSDFERVRILTDRIVVNITDNETRPDQGEFQKLSYTGLDVHALI